MTAASRYGNAKIWRRLETPGRGGKTYQSVPTQLPVTWHREGGQGDEVITYISDTGEYEIIAKPYGSGGRRIYTIKRDGEEIGFGLAQLKEAKMHVRNNARGRERVHVA